MIEVRISGKLTKEAYYDFVPRIEAAIQKYGTIRFLLITLGFHGWNAGALWEDLKFDLKHFQHIEQLAIVGETNGKMACRDFAAHL